MFRFPLLALCVLTVAPLAADDKSDRRSRAAKVALALATPRAKPATAPAPRPGVPGYGSGYSQAVKDNKPLVVFVSCVPWQVEGAVVAKTEGPFAGNAGPAVVVGFPDGERLLVDTTTTCDREKVDAAVKSAQRKIDHKPKDNNKPAAPKPLKWDV